MSDLVSQISEDGGQKSDTAVVIAAPTIDGQAALVDPLESSSHDKGREIASACQRADRGMRAIAIAGCLLLQAKAEIKHGQFKTWLKAYAFPGMGSKSFEAAWRKADRYMVATKALIEDLKTKFDNLANLSISGFPKLLSFENSQISQDTPPEQLQLLEYLDEQTASHFMGIKKHGKGGFRPDEKEVQRWLKQYYPEFKGTKYADLEPRLQKEFRKALKHGLVKRTNPKPEGSEQLAKERVEALVNLLHEVQAEGYIGFIPDDLLTRLEDERLSIGRMIKLALQARKIGETTEGTENTEEDPSASDSLNH